MVSVNKHRIWPVIWKISLERGDLRATKISQRESDNNC